MTLVLATSACTISGKAVPIPGAENLAVVDAPGTTAALDAVKTAAEAIFTYDSANPAALDQAAGANLTGDAKTQFTALFAEIRKSSQPVHLTTRVLQNAALELTGNRARTLAALAQVNGTTKGLATVAFTALKADGRWRISDIKVNPALPALAPQPDDGSPAGLRDSALTGARAAATALLTTNSADPEGTYARAEAVTAEPLLSEYRATKAAYVDGIRTSGSRVDVPPDLVTGVTALLGGKATVLLYASLRVTDATGKATPKPLTILLDVVREGTAWKATGIRTVTAA